MSKQIKTLELGPFGVNCYLYWDDDSGEGVVIDPGAAAPDIIASISAAEMKPLAILLTHGHGDHIAAVADVKEKYGIPLYVGTGEEELLSNPSANVSAMIGEPIVAPKPEHLVNDDDLLTFGAISLRVLSTPGHTIGGVCFLDESEGRLFCGDTLFYGSVGRTDFPGGSTTTLMKSIQEKILTLPDGIICHPGHGPATTVGAERTNNPFLNGQYNV